MADECIETPGGRIACTVAGPDDAPVLLLIHGLGGRRNTWRELVESLAVDHRVIAPDLPGHGDSDAPSGDYSLGAHATAMRDVLAVLRIPAATVIGHSLGGGVALQFCYQFPERSSRLVLVSSGGLGPEVSLMLRAATLPGADAVVAGLAQVPQAITRRVLPVISHLPLVLAREDAGALAGTLRDLGDRRSRTAFLRTARSVIDWRGQTVSAVRRLYLLTDLPVMITWGTNDRTIPPEHHRAFAREVSTARVVEIADAGHFPHETAAARLLPELLAFLAATAPFAYTEERFRQLLTGEEGPVAPGG